MSCNLGIPALQPASEYTVKIFSTFFAHYVAVKLVYKNNSIFVDT